MNVAQYTFQSPSTNPVQVGKLDQSSVKEEKQEKVETKPVENNAATQQLEQKKQQKTLLDVYA